jgi:hypothetical protein
MAPADQLEGVRQNSAGQVVSCLQGSFWFPTAHRSFDWINWQLLRRIAVESSLALKAEQYMRALYSGDVGEVEGLVSEDIVISYPVFENLFGTPEIRSRKSAKDFAVHFSSRWSDQELKIHESVSQGSKVVLVWEFSARNIAPLSPDQPATQERRTWGGITLIQFDGSGRIRAEIGEESTPGPIGRTNSVGVS